MTPAETKLLSAVGKTLLYQNLATPLIACISYGISLPLIVLTGLILARKSKPDHRPTLILLYGTITCLLLLSLHFAGETTKASMDFDLARAASHYDGTLPSIQRELTYYTDRKWKPLLIRNWADSVGLIVSDAVVIWRACVLLPSRRRWAVLPPMFLLLASAVLSIGACVIGSTIKGSKIITSPWSIKANTLTEASYFLSFATNLLATAIFGYRLRHLRQMAPKSKENQSHKTPIHRTLWLLVESGVFFCTFQTAVIVIQLLNILDALNTLQSVLISDIIIRFQYSFSILYPVLVVVLVRTRNSAVDTHSPSPEPQSEPTQRGSTEISPSETKV